MHKINYLVFILFIYTACNTSKTSDGQEGEVAEDTTEYIEYNNPPAEGFNQEGSDLLATLLADKVMNAMGGRQAWDNTRHLSWSFFGKRKHVWDKQTGDIRVEDPAKGMTILMNINTKEGKVMKQGEELTQPDSLAKYLNIGYRAWINDSYWLFMPYKLKDSGVTLSYLGEDTTETGRRADVLKLTFENVGVTPQNYYHVWVDVDSKLVTQWAYFKDQEQTVPMFVNAWDDYKKYGNIMLSGERGNGRKLSDIKVLDQVPENTFSTFDTPTL